MISTINFLNQDSNKINKINKISFCRLAELVSASPAVTVETLKQVQGDGFKKGDGLPVKTHNYASLRLTIIH